MASQQPGHSRRWKKACWDTEGTCDLAAPKGDGKKQQQWRNTKKQINPIIPEPKHTGGLRMWQESRAGYRVSVSRCLSRWKQPDYALAFMSPREVGRSQRAKTGNTALRRPWHLVPTACIKWLTTTYTSSSCESPVGLIRNLHTHDTCTHMHTN